MFGIGIKLSLNQLYWSEFVVWILIVSTKLIPAAQNSIEKFKTDQKRFDLFKFNWERSKKLIHCVFFDLFWLFQSFNWIFRSLNQHESHLFWSFNRKVVKLNQKEIEMVKFDRKEMKIDQIQNHPYDFDVGIRIVI